MNPSTVAGIASAVFVSFSALGTWSVLTTLAQSRRSRSWPVAKGKITHSELTQQIETERDDDDNGRVRTTTMYGVKLAYAYVVGGQSLEGSRLYWADGIKTNVEGPARKILEKYPLNRNVDVYYQPDKPSVALLEPNSVKGVVMIGVFAAAFLIFGLVFLAVSLHASQS